MPELSTDVVTGAFGYSGRYIARRLMDGGRTVRTLTNSPGRAHEFGESIKVRPLAFDDHAALVGSLSGCEVLYNTYWVRFNHGDFTMAGAVENTLKLFDAAKIAGVRRVVHVSITNPSEDSPFEYFRGKARLEKGLIESGLSYAILRPAVLFGGADILINNIAWTLRKLPIVGIFGDGRYRVQPMHVDDFAKLAVEQGSGEENAIVDGVGPEMFTYRELMETIGGIIGKKRMMVRVPAWTGLAFAWGMGKMTGDVMLTREEIGALMADLLCSDAPPTGSTKLTEWATRHADELGRKYACELARRRNRTEAYDAL